MSSLQAHMDGKNAVAGLGWLTSLRQQAQLRISRRQTLGVLIAWRTEKIRTTKPREWSAPATARGVP